MIQNSLNKELQGLLQRYWVKPGSVRISKIQQDIPTIGEIEIAGEFRALAVQPLGPTGARGPWYPESPKACISSLINKILNLQGESPALYRIKADALEARSLISQGDYWNYFCQYPELLNG